jgi:hypothetical protein
MNWPGELAVTGFALIGVLAVLEWLQQWWHRHRHPRRSTLPFHPRLR